MRKRVERFEDLIAWQKARSMTRDLYSRATEGRFGQDYELSRQIRRALMSISSNIAEGFDRGNRNEFTQYLSVAKASCAEVRNQRYLAADMGYIDEGTATSLIDKANEVARIVTGLRTAVARRRVRPTQSSVLSPQS